MATKKWADAKFTIELQAVADGIAINRHVWEIVVYDERAEDIAVCAWRRRRAASRIF
jgi:hypothetical protein